MLSEYKKKTLPIIRYIAEWEYEHGSVACILPGEYDDFMKGLKRAALSASCRPAMIAIDKNFKERMKERVG